MSERRMPWAACLWPGLPSLWTRGAWSGLVLAAACAGLLNFLVAATWVWSEWIDPGIRIAGWSVLLGLWLTALVAGRCGWDTWRLVAGRWAGLRVPPAGVSVALIEGKPAAALFGEVQSQYLQGNWLQAETLLRHLLRRDPRDVEARLMLATLCRHVGRPDEAAGELRRLERMDEARKWRQEIRMERAYLVRAVKERGGEAADAGEAVPEREQPVDG